VTNAVLSSIALTLAIWAVYPTFEKSTRRAWIWVLANAVIVGLVFLLGLLA